MTIASGRVAPSPTSVDAVAYHEQLATGWTQRYALGGFRRRAEFFVDSVLPLADCQGSWLDVGCGSGFFSRILAARGASVLGVDGSSGMIESARAAPSPAGAKAPRYELQSIEDLSRLDGPFDGAICLSVIEYLDDPKASIGAIARLVRPGGRLLLSAPNRHSTLRLAQRMLRSMAAVVGSEAFPYLDSSRNRWSRRELAALLETQGFACEKVLGFDPVAPRHLWGLVSPSLWFAVCRRRETRDAA